MIRTGENILDGVPVEVVRKRIRCINVRIRPDGRVLLSVPKWWVTLREGEAFLRSKWRWVLKSREEILSRPPVSQTPVTPEDYRRLQTLIAGLHTVWTFRLAEPGVTFRLRKMKSLWGSCHWRNRTITYSTELVAASRELVEYVVVHELTHLQAHDHGPRFYALMDARLPDWKALRRHLNKRQFAAGVPPSTPVLCRTLTQGEFCF